MDFNSGLNNLSNGRAIKRPSMVGYIERVMVTAKEATPSQFSATVAYTTGTKVTYNGKYYRAKSNTTAGTLPTDTTKWDVYTLVPEEYKLVWHNRSGDTYEFYYNTPSGTSRVNATDLILNKELIGHITATDWFDGLAADFAEAADADSALEW